MSLLGAATSHARRATAAALAAANAAATTPTTTLRTWTDRARDSTRGGATSAITNLVDWGRRTLQAVTAPAMQQTLATSQSASTASTQAAMPSRGAGGLLAEAAEASRRLHESIIGDITRAPFERVGALARTLRVAISEGMTDPGLLSAIVEKSARAGGLDFAQEVVEVEKLSSRAININPLGPLFDAVTNSRLVSTPIDTEFGESVRELVEGTVDLQEKITDAALGPIADALLALASAIDIGGILQLGLTRLAKATTGVPIELARLMWTQLGTQVGEVGEDGKVSGLAPPLPIPSEMLASLQDAGLWPSLGNLLKFVGLAIVRQVALGQLPPVERWFTQTANRLVQNAVPGPSDLVRFQVREAFDETFRAAQLDPPPSGAFRDAMTNHGFSEYWSDSYWASHWDLPSIQLGFEMFHRLRPGRVPDDAVFSTESLRQLLTIQDILPRYHDQIIRVSHTPFTRVDIRRMFRSGVLTYDEMVEAYRDIGYTETDAQRLADFTERDYDPEERALAKGEIMVGYREDVLRRDEATTLLVGLGYSPSDAETLLRTQDQQTHAREAKAQATANLRLLRLREKYRNQILKGRFDEELAIAELMALDLSAADAHGFLATHVRASAPPTLAAP